MDEGKQGQWGQKWVGYGSNTANVKFSTGNWNCDAYDRFFIGLPAALQVQIHFKIAEKLLRNCDFVVI